MLKYSTLMYLSLVFGQVQAADQWLLTTDLWGNPVYGTLTLTLNGDNLCGDIDGDKLSGHRQGASLIFESINMDGTVYNYEGKMQDNTIDGIADFPDTNNPSVRVKHAFSARKIATRPEGQPRRYEFMPTNYSNLFDPHRTPVLTIWPGDTVQTKTIDSGGVDEHGETKALFGNPQTGPFFIATAAPGDTLVIRINRLRLNRDYADSLDAIVGRALGARFATQADELGKPVRWKLDRARGIASLETPTEHLKDYRVKVRPMLGGLAVAPGFGSAPISTGDTGRFGGNMDFNEVIEGNIVYLPVQQPGALLYLGDAHALQGDGETSQYALETSMDVEFTVDVIKDKSVAMPRVESPDQIMVLGQAGSLDEALRSATTGLIQWLQQDYGLTLPECAILLGSAAHYSVPNLAGRSVGVALKLDKSLLTMPRLLGKG
ncbi:acetamidase/formamidase family protein [Shewanella sp.]|uniref:acetamidase/formamidase family protein n=1 Tax=Shewanella sp. TaxID=50422 RepID=UPI0026378E4E|nr:acetamidase/formamidase family protein [Shewanella sp.]